MADNRLRIGTHFTRQGREYVIEGSLPSGELRVKDLLTQEYTAKTAAEIVHELCFEDLEIVGEDQNLPFLKEKLADSRASDLSILDRDEKGEARKREAHRREHYVSEVTSRHLTAFTPQSLKPVIDAISAKIKDPKPPSWRTLLRWYKDYTGSGEDVRSLVPAWNKRGNGKKRYSGTRLKQYGEEVLNKAAVVAKIMEAVVSTVFLRMPPAKVASVYEVLKARIYEYNQHRGEWDKLPVPSQNSLYRYIETLDPYEVAVAREGKRRADDKWRANQQGPRPTRPLQLAQADHTRADMMVVDTKMRIPLGRPWITIIMDVYTKLILGMYIGFTRPSSASINYCLRHAIRSKTYVQKVYPEIENTWDAYGIPEMLTVDNAKEFYGRDFKNACFQLKIVPHYAPRRTPRYKGGMERLFGRINTELLHELPGTTFSNVFEKGDYDPKKHAVISLDDFIELAHTYIIDIYHQQIHKGIMDIPAKRWRESTKEWQPNIPARKADLDVLLGHTFERSIDSNGIEFETLIYNSHELGLLRRRLKPGTPAVIKLDIEDVSHIHVYDEMNDRLLPVPALDQEYTQGLTLHQHLVIKSYRRKVAELHKDGDGLARAKLRLQQIVERAMGSSRLLAGRDKVARYLNLGMPNYADLVEIEGADDSAFAPEPGAGPAPGREVGAASLAGISSPQGPQEYHGEEEVVMAELDEGAGASGGRASGGRRKKSAKKAGGENSKRGGKRTKSPSEDGPMNDPRDGSALADDDANSDSTEWGSDYELPV